MNTTTTRRLLPAGLLSLAAGLGFALPSSAAPIPVGHLYEPTNASTGNAVQVFDQYADGHLVAGATVPSGGLGTGTSLHSQGGAVRAGNLLFVVNGGSSSVSAFAVTARGLVLRGTVPSGGVLPVSVTVHDGVGYVVNQGDDTISGFRYTGGGVLTPLRSSTRALTPNPAGGVTDAAQISFTPDGSRLIVTEKASNVLDTFRVDRLGLTSTASAQPSAGTTPYGFDFDSHGNAVVSEASTGSASSYRVVGPTLKVISGAVSDTQAAACWLVVGPDRTTAWAVNAASHSVSSYTVSPSGALTLRAAVAADTVQGGTDTAVSADGRWLHVRLGAGLVSTWAIGRGGVLKAAGSTQGALAFGSAGLATS